MAFAEADRVQLRRWLAVAPIYQATDPRFESAITSVQASSDGGSLPDNSTELAIKGYLAKLAAIEVQRTELIEQMQAHKLADITVDPVRALAGLNQIGRQYVGHISDALSCPPRRDVFSPARTG